MNNLGEVMFVVCSLWFEKWREVRGRRAVIRETPRSFYSIRVIYTTNTAPEERHIPVKIFTQRIQRRAKSAKLHQTDIREIRGKKVREEWTEVRGRRKAIKTPRFFIQEKFELLN